MTDPHAWFLCGTDTEIGKTFVACALLHALRRRGLTALGMKPVAAGAELVDGVWVNEDAARLSAASSYAPDPQTLNPYCFKRPVAPHLAAAEEGVRIELERIIAAFASLCAQADVVIVEGVGGFRVPLGDACDSADLAVALGVPVILVVGMRLGCINHALLACEAIEARGLTLAGWIANTIDPAMLSFNENVVALQSRIHAPLLGVVPRLANADPALAASLLHLPGDPGRLVRLAD